VKVDPERRAFMIDALVEAECRLVLVADELHALGYQGGGSLLKEALASTQLVRKGLEETNRLIGVGS